MFCRNCGKELSADSKFCTNCGCPVQNVLELDVSKERTDCETVCSEHIESCGSEEAASHIENNKSENVSDIFDRLAYYRQNEKTDSEEYRKTVKQEKKAYFWYKLMAFALLLAFATATEMFVRNEHIGVRVLVVILFFVAVGAIVFLCGKRIESFTNLKFLADNDNEDRSDRLKAQFEREHAGGFRWIKRLEILAVILGVIMFCISLFSEDAGVAASIYVGIKTFYQYGLIFLSVWTFKWACILVWVILFVLPGGVLLLNWESSNLPYGAFNSGPDTDVFAENKYADMIEVDYSNCYVYMTAYTEVPVFHLEYKFTNNTDQTTSAFNIFTAKASQNGIEATTYYNLDLDENELKEVAPDATIGIAEEFELNDIETPLVVQFAETWNFTE